MTTGFLTWAVKWLVEPFAEMRNLGRFGGEKDEMNVGLAEFQVPKGNPIECIK